MRYLLIFAIIVAIACLYSCEIGEESAFMGYYLFSETDETETELEETDLVEVELVEEGFEFQDHALRKFYLTCLKITFIDEETGIPISETTHLLRKE